MKLYQSRREIATLAAGCFWCVEAVFKELKGVQSVRSGYAGDSAATANYRSVCGGETGKTDRNQDELHEMVH